MCYPYKRAVMEADRDIFGKWLRAIAAFYGTVALLVTCAIAIGHTIGHVQSDVAAIIMSSSSLPPRAQ